jgi:hypothetical protein
MWSERSAISTSLAAACERVGAELVFRSGSTDVPSPPPHPALLAALLPAGERVLPSDLVREMDAHVDLCLLLLCEEALLRPTLTIQEGRIVLLEPPLTASRIEARLRLLMTARCVESAGGWSAAALESAETPAERHRTADFWFAVFMGAAAEQRRAISWRVRPRQGLSCALSEAPLDAGAVPALASSHDPPGEDAERGCRAVLGEGGALVHLDPSACEWRFLLPDDGFVLRVFSHQRLPRAWDAGRALARSKSRLFRLAAAPGDVICLATAATADLPTTLEHAALDGGGPALFQTLVTRCTPAAADVAAGVVVEVM